MDTAKHVFELHGVDEREQPVLRRRLGRKEVERFFAGLAPTRIGLEACGGSHHWARELRALGHAVVLIPPQYVKPYVDRGKNDAADAAAICEAMSRPGMRFVPMKSAEQQAGLMLLKVRDLLVKERTMLINALRGHAAELLVRLNRGRSWRCCLSVPPADANCGAGAREMLKVLADQIAALEARIATSSTADAAAQGEPREPMPGNATRHRPDRRRRLASR